MKDCYSMDQVLPKYRNAMRKELTLHSADDVSAHLGQQRNILDASVQMYNIAWRLFETARMSFVTRSYNLRYGLSDAPIVYESVGGHANLTAAIVDEALNFLHGDGLDILLDRTLQLEYRYTYREIMTAVRLHDLGENKYGDIPDNGARDDAEKDRRELEYIKHYIVTFAADDEIFGYNVLRLLREMQEKKTPIGRLMYLSDKTAATIVTLCLDLMEDSPMMNRDSPYASGRDHDEMALCDYSVTRPEGEYYRASEMWTVDFFKMRNIVELDNTGFFTALIIMATIMVHGNWYKWRENDYLEKDNNCSNPA